MATTVTTVRKDRTSYGILKRGRTHRWADGQTWCGRKIPGVAAWNLHAEPGDVDCPECLTAIRQDRPRERKR